MTKKYFFMLVIWGVLLAATASAQLMIEEGKIKQSVFPGERFTGTITVHNTSTVPIDLVVYLEDFEYVAPFNGSKKFYPAATLDRSAASWISFQPKDMHLEAHQESRLNYTVAVPEDASGGYYGVLFFEGSDRQQLTQGQVALNIVARVGALLFFETRGRVKSVEFNKAQVRDNKITGILRNSGNVNLIIRCLYYILDPTGIAVDRGESPSFYMPPDGSRDISLDIASDIGPGDYTAVLTFDLEEGDSSVKEVNFEI